MLLKISLPILFVLNMFISDVNIAKNNDADCVQNVSGEVRDKNLRELLEGVEVMLLDDSDNVLKSIVIKKDAVFSFKVKCNSNYTIKAQKKGYKLQEKEFKTTRKKGETMKLMIILGLHKE